MMELRLNYDDLLTAVYQDASGAGGSLYESLSLERLLLHWRIERGIEQIRSDLKLNEHWLDDFALAAQNDFFFESQPPAAECLICPSSLLHLLSVVSDECQQRWWRLRMFVENLREKARLLRQCLRFLKLIVRLRLKRAAHPLWAYRLLFAERDWYLLHGSHPPRLDAGVCGPALADLGRVRCTVVH